MTPGLKGAMFQQHFPKDYDPNQLFPIYSDVPQIDLVVWELNLGPCLGIHALCYSVTS